MEPIIDASIFLGVNHETPEIRKKCIQIILQNFCNGVEINLEQIGLYDKIIWQHPKEERLAYYPFMKHLHSAMDFKYIPCVDEAYQLAAIDHRINLLSMTKSILACHVIVGERRLYTIDNDLKNLSALSNYIIPVASSSIAKSSFTEPLYTLHRKSLRLKIKQVGGST